MPTRELAAQVQDSVRTYGKYLKLRSTVIFGGVGFNPQADELRRGVDIVVATPGRLLDHVQQRTIDLRQVEILVLDEADRMLDMGFIPAIRRILALLPAKRQNLLFSATFPDEIRKLAGSFMHDPATVEVAPRNRPVELISQVRLLRGHEDRKRELLAHLVKTNNWQQVLVFTKTKHGANRLAQQLERDGIDADAIHGNKSQRARTRTLKRFKDNELQVLVATDIASRGLDIEELPHVVNYDLPHVAEDYVHRIGRTGRAGASGEAVSLVCGEDRPLLAAIERLDRQAHRAAAPSPATNPARHPMHRQPATSRRDATSRRNAGGSTTGKRVKGVTATAIAMAGRSRGKSLARPRMVRATGRRRTRNLVGNPTATVARAHGRPPGKPAPDLALPRTACRAADIRHNARAHNRPGRRARDRTATHAGKPAAATARAARSGLRPASRTAAAMRGSSFLTRTGSRRRSAPRTSCFLAFLGSFGRKGPVTPVRRRLSSNGDLYI